MIETTTPDARLLTLHPVLLVADIAETIRWYEEALGFVKDWEHGDPAFYASVSRDGITVHLRHLDSPLPHHRHEEADTVDFYIMVSDVDRLHSEFLRRGANIIYGPVSQDYGMREFYIEDGNGYRLCFGQPLSASGSTTSTLR
jgi:catechol 2,3-dioxygenase-like lactoylglutathione lyase family enzyme